MYTTYIHNYIIFFWFIVLAVLKKNYIRLCHCLPQDYMRTISKLQRLPQTCIDLSNLTDLPTVDLINEKLVGFLMTVIQSDMDALQFCDIMENLVDCNSSTTDIEILRNGIFLENYKLNKNTLGVKKCEAMQKQHCNSVHLTKIFDIN